MLSLDWKGLILDLEADLAVWLGTLQLGLDRRYFFLGQLLQITSYELGVLFENFSDRTLVWHHLGHIYFFVLTSKNLELRIIYQSRWKLFILIWIRKDIGWANCFSATSFTLACLACWVKSKQDLSAHPTHSTQP